MVIMMLILINQVSAGIMNIYPSDDAYTDDNKRNNNFDNLNLRVGNDANHGKHRSYLKFDLSELNGKTINSAKFGIDPFSPLNDVTVNLHYISSDSWRENSITWNNAPSYSSSITDSKVFVGNSGSVVEFDVFSLINEQDNILSFALVSSQESISNRYVQFFSKDMTDEFYDPYLEVSYDGGGSCNTDADVNCDGCVSLIEYNDFKYGYKNGLFSGVDLISYNDIKYGFKFGLVSC